MIGFACDKCDATLQATSAQAAMAEARAAGWTLPNEQTGWQTLCRDHSKELPRNRLALVADLGGEAGAA